MQKEEIFDFPPEEEEENIDIQCGYENKEDEEFDEIVGFLQEIVLESDFENLQNSYFKKHCLIFENKEENKFEYMDIFKKYQIELESFINKSLKSKLPGFDMLDFLQSLEKRKNQIDEQLLDMLFSLSDFQIFKEIMLEEKKKFLKEQEKTFKKNKIVKKHANFKENIFYVDKTKNNPNLFKDEKKIEKKNEKEKYQSLDSHPDLCLDIISLTPQIHNKKGKKN